MTAKGCNMGFQLSIVDHFFYGSRIWKSQTPDAPAMYGQSNTLVNIKQSNVNAVCNIAAAKHELYQSIKHR